MGGRVDERWELQPPTTPPHRTGGKPARCAGTAALQAAAVAAAALALVTATMIASGDDGRLSTTAVPVVLATGVAAAAAIAVAVRRWGAALTDELLAGYTTSAPTAGAWWLPHRRPDRPAGWVHWDWTGIEVRRRDGTVRAPATAGVPAPGFYPSPHEPDRLELWTGSQWTRRYLDPSLG
ncbi:MAG TPA: hypothetical protein VFU14_14585 [Acidimicrobiales bacterium]|nr:hypothetical protein [Acidimicrobiales bacterium]